MNLEDDLRRALRRESPPAGFASRVLQRIERGETPKRRQWWRAVAASLTLTAILGGVMYERYREGQRAKEELMQALSIAGEKVRYAQNEVRTIGSQD